MKPRFLRETSILPTHLFVMVAAGSDFASWSARRYANIARKANRKVMPNRGVVYSAGCPASKFQPGTP
jgi:hypothetical protein